MNAPQTVYVIDDEDTVREGLRTLLSSVHLPVETCSTAQQFLDAYDSSRGGCVVLDIRMPGMSGLELLEQFPSRGIHLPVIVITGYGEVTTAVRAMKAGAIDFFQKPFSFQELLERIQQALAREAEERAARQQRQELLNRIARLTAREQEVLHRVVDGKGNKVIAAELGISVKTVEAFRAKIMEKMRADSLAHLVRMVLAAQDSVRITTESTENAPRRQVKAEK
jgi:two-component system response regulator FixJ